MNAEYDIDNNDNNEYSRERKYFVKSLEKFLRLLAYIFIEITLWIYHVNANEKFAKISIFLQSITLLIRKMTLMIA